MTTLHLSQQDARLLHLTAQGLRTLPRRKATRTDVLDAIRRMGLLQIDTISVVARSPYLVLFSRLGAYDPAWLDSLLADGSLFEYWAHEACFIPAEDYALMRPRMLDPSSMGWKNPARWLAEHQDDADRLLDHIRTHGAVRSADFVRHTGKSDGWWDWKPEKRHLEALFTLGRVMVSERRGFQRIYDLAERVRPGWDDDRDLPDAQSVARALLHNTCRALGVFRAAWVADYYRQRRIRPETALQAMVDDGTLLAVRIEGWKHDGFVHASLRPALEAAQAGRLSSSVTAVLSPFDPVVWDRQRARELFGFDYRIECYTPAAKRRYGYFVLPILSCGRMVGRMDAKAHRAQGVFEIRALYLEPGVRPTRKLARDLLRALRGLAAWHGTPQLHCAQMPAPLRVCWDDVCRAEAAASP